MSLYCLPSSQPKTARTAYRLRAHLMIQCLSAHCAHQTQIGPKELIDLGHGDVHLDYAARRMKCTRCGHLGAKVEIHV